MVSVNDFNGVWTDNTIYNPFGKVEPIISIYIKGKRFKKQKRSELYQLILSGNDTYNGVFRISQYSFKMKREIDGQAPTPCFIIGDFTTPITTNEVLSKEEIIRIFLNELKDIDIQLENIKVPNFEEYYKLPRLFFK